MGTVTWVVGLLFACTLTFAEILPDAERDGIPAVKEWAARRIVEAQKDFESSLKYTPSPDAWSAEITYQIMMDRFNNGDPTNDDKNLPSIQKSSNGRDLYGIQEWRHGGDLQGIIDRLDYLQDLGITSLWITPIFQMDGSYHGYCTTDPTQIDPGFGTKELFREMVQEAHKRDIRVVLDVVVNHMCDSDTHYREGSLKNHEQCADDLNEKYWSGDAGESTSQGYLDFSEHFFPPLRSQYFFSRCGANSGADTSGTGPAAVFGDFTALMFDYDTRNYDFQDIFTAIQQYWIAYADVDGFRLDAAKHVTEDFLAEFSTTIRAYARSIGKDNFLVIGEVAAPADWIGRRLGKMFSNPENPDEHGNVPISLTYKLKKLKSTYLADSKHPYPGLNAVYDFDESGTSRSALLGLSKSSTVADYFASNGYNTIAGNGNPLESWTLLAIHDWPRFMDHITEDYAGRLVSGLGYLLTAPGTPILYYGVEQGFSGNCNYDNIHVGQAFQDVKSACDSDRDEEWRQDMFATGPWKLRSAIQEIDDLAYIGASKGSAPSSWKTDPFLRRDHFYYRIARALTRIRRSCGPLTHGFASWRNAEPRVNGLLAFSRIFDGEEVLTIINPSPSDYILSNPITVDSNINNQNGVVYKNLLDPSQSAFVGDSNGGKALYFHNLKADPFSVLIFVENSRVGPYDRDLGASLCHGSSNAASDVASRECPKIRSAWMCKAIAIPCRWVRGRCTK